MKTAESERMDDECIVGSGCLVFVAVNYPIEMRKQHPHVD